MSQFFILFLDVSHVPYFGCDNSLTHSFIPCYIQSSGKYIFHCPSYLNNLLRPLDHLLIVILRSNSISIIICLYMPHRQHTLPYPYAKPTHFTRVLSRYSKKCITLLKLKNYIWLLRPQFFNIKKKTLGCHIS